MLLQIVSLGAALTMPTARLHTSAVSRSAVVTMNDYLESTIRKTSSSAAAPKTYLESTLKGAVAPTKAPVDDDATRDDADFVLPPPPVAAATYAAAQAAVAAQAPAAYAPVEAAPTPFVNSRVARIMGPLALAAGAAASTFLYTSSAADAEAITMDEVLQAQKEWGDAIVRISKVWLKKGDFKVEAEKAADELYGYGSGMDVLFKPTKAKETPFRPTGEGALSYFIGGDQFFGGFDEDHGFALGPDGDGWKKVIFDNNKIDLNGNTAQAMGEYYFYSAKDGSVAKVEYTFGYKRNADGKLRIYLHHSSLPYPGSKPKPPAPITLEEVVLAQRQWGDAIVRISKTNLQGGDVQAEALKAADELYAYGRSDVLFKPTKAALEPFRPTPEGALSYFIGGNPEFEEDHGFALGPDEKGWKKVVFDNNKIDFNGATAQAMGEYYFTATDGATAKVEYTFGYKRCDDGKIRVYLHHSSLPYPGPKKA